MIILIGYEYTTCKVMFKCITCKCSNQYLIDMDNNKCRYQDFITCKCSNQYLIDMDNNKCRYQDFNRCFEQQSEFTMAANI